MLKKLPKKHGYSVIIQSHGVEYLVRYHLPADSDIDPNDMDTVGVFSELVLSIPTESDDIVFRHEFDYLAFCELLEVETVDIFAKMFKNIAIEVVNEYNIQLNREQNLRRLQGEQAKEL